MNPEASHGLPPEITDLLDRTPAVTPADMERLRRAAVELDADPGFQADYWKGHFVSAVLDGMEKRALTQSELARRWGKTRQYLNKILDEDGRVNFTIETMVELAMLVGKRLRLELEDCAEFAFSAQFKRDSRAVHALPYPNFEEVPGSLPDLEFPADLPALQSAAAAESHDELPLAA